MAEQEEEIVIIEEDEAAAQPSVEEETNKQNKTDTKNAEEEEEEKKQLLIFAALAGVLILLLAILAIIIVLKVKKKKEAPTISTTHIEQKLQDHKIKIEPSKLENLIAKANYLYTNGQKQQALKIYEYIAQYSEAISQYNLGVARLKNKQYKEALQSFNLAIQNGEKRCVSAINAAVCSLYLKKKEDFEYYINMAKAYLPNEINSPLYAYYYTLIKFYSQNYYEALASVDQTKSKEYIEQTKKLKAKLSALFQSNYPAIEALEDIPNSKNYFSRALLYARVGDLTLAKTNFEAAIVKHDMPKKATAGLIYTEIKMGLIDNAATTLKDVNKHYEENIFQDYPITVFLKHSLFNPIKAQDVYRKDIKKNEWIIFQELFYFSPYKIFNANQTINYIRKGNATSYIDSIDSAEDFLQKSASTSSVNKGIAQAIKLALRFRVRQANTILKELVKIQPKHSILHYNLALTYAQLGDMHNAYRHFIWSYHLNAKNYLPGIYAYMCSKLIHNEDKKLLSTLKNTLAEDTEKSKEQLQFYTTLLQVAQNDWLDAIDWLDTKYKTRPIYLAMKHLIALHMNKEEQAAQSAKKLTLLLPNEILPHIMYMNAKFYKDERAEYAKHVMTYLKKQHFHYNDLYYGPSITHYLYIQEHLITGKIYKLVQLLQHKLNVTADEDIIDIQQALALALFYNKEFEESYVLYNSLVDNLKIRDAKTLFLAATASIAANHHANAIALLELSKLQDKRYKESRFALGLLYLEVNNPKGAVIEFARMKTNNFHSHFFNFNIDNDKLTFKHLHPNEN